jgi:hypothetical protein
LVKGYAVESIERGENKPIEHESIKTGGEPSVLGFIGFGEGQRVPSLYGLLSNSNSRKKFSRLNANHQFDLFTL